MKIMSFSKKILLSFFIVGIMNLIIATEKESDVLVYGHNTLLSTSYSSVSNAEYEPFTKNSKILSTVQSFNFLFDRAKKLSELPEASIQSISKRLEYLINHPDIFKMPDCPELEFLGIEPSTQQILYQKINRYLFDEVDDALKDQFHTTYPAGSFSFPVIEWAVNIMPNFEFDIIDTFNENQPFSNNLKSFVDKHYSPGLLKSYFEQGKILLTERQKDIAELNTDNNSKYLEELYNRLRCDMCYPARVSAMYGSIRIVNSY